MTDEERTRIAVTFEQIAATCNSHYDAISRLVANETACHNVVSAQADAINNHTKLLEAIQLACTKNFSELAALINQQNKVLEALRALVLPKEDTVN